MNDCIDIHTHIVPENFPPYAGKGKDVPWPSMAAAHACHRHVMIKGNVYRTVSDGCWSVPLHDANAMVRFLNEEIARMIGRAAERFVGLGCVPLQDADAAIVELEYVM